MARIRIEFPTTELFSTTIPVRITDLNYGRHVGNDVFLRYLQEARMELFKHWGYASETQIEGTVGLIMADVAANYRAEGFYGDVLRISVSVADVSRSGFDLLYRITKEEGGQEVLLAKTGMVCFDYEQRKVASLPDSLRMRLQG